MMSRTMSAPLILAVIGLGALITALDQTVVVTALPTIMPDLKIPSTPAGLDRASWIITAYLLGYVSAMPLLGRIGDIYGFARIYQLGLVIFSIGTSIVALAPNVEWAIGGRVVQAIGGGATIPIGIAIASTVLPPRRRGLAIGIVVAAAEAGAMLGPAYGGAIVELLSWRWIFWLNIPQSAIIFVALAWLPNKRNAGIRVDYLGGMLLTVALVILSLALATEGLFTLSSPTPFIILAPGLVLVGVLAITERRILQPLLAPFLFRSRAFVMANLTQMLEGVALIIALVTIPLMANTVMGKDPITGAWWLLRMTIAIPVGAIVGGYFLPLTGIRPMTVVGLGLSAIGLFLIGTWELDISEPWLSLHLSLVGFGFGLNNAPIMTRALNSVKEYYRGTVASLVTVSRMIGMALGLAALSAWGVEHFQALTVGLDFPLEIPGETAEALQARREVWAVGIRDAGLSLFHNFFHIAAAVALVAILPALAMRADRTETEKNH